MPQNTLHQSPTAIALLLRATRRYGDLPAFEWADGAITYRDIELFMGRAQSVLAREALAVGDTIATLSRNGAEDWLLARAAQGLGLCVLALHPMGSLQDHLKYMTAAGVRCLLVDGHGYAERGAELAAARPDVRVLSIGAAGFADDILAAIQAEAPVAVRDISQPDAVAGRHFTGGTTGEPKQIVITHRGFTAGIHAFRANVELPSVPRVVAASADPRHRGAAYQHHADGAHHDLQPAGLTGPGGGRSQLASGRRAAPCTRRRPCTSSRNCR